MRKLPISAITLVLLTSCTAIKKVEQEQIICKWGTQQFDLCQFDTQDQRVEALIAEMTLKTHIAFECVKI